MNNVCIDARVPCVDESFGLSKDPPLPAAERFAELAAQVIRHVDAMVFERK